MVLAQLIGEVDLSNVDPVSEALFGSITATTECLVVDLSGTTHLDSTGVRMLFELAVRLHGQRRQLRLVVSDSAIVRRVLVLTKLEQSVPFDASVHDAVAAGR